jgi:DNA-damage-inducible protein J
MSKTATITVRLDPKVKEDAQAVFHQLGLTTTQAISLFLGQVSLQKGLPFELRIPNAETTQAIEDGLAGRNLKTFKDAADALKYLGLPDA